MLQRLLVLVQLSTQARRIARQIEAQQGEPAMTVRPAREEAAGADDCSRETKEV